MNIAATILAQGQDSAVALLHKGSVLTYRDLRSQVAEIARALLGRGHVAGDRIGIFSENSFFFILAYFGTISADCVAVPFQTESTEESFSCIIADTGIHTVFVSRRYYNRLLPWAATAGLTLLPEPGQGSTGYQPVPSGYQPNGTVAAVQTNENDLSRKSPTAVPVGRLPAGAGKSPAPPILRVLPTTSLPPAPTSDFGLRTSDLASAPPSPISHLPSSGESQPPPSVLRRPSSGNLPSSNSNLPSSGGESPTALAALMFTSGSTGKPKGVMVTHRNIECNTRDIVSYLGLTSADRVMAVLPFHYCFGISLLHTLLMVGGSVVLNSEFKLFPEAMLRELQEKECTGFAGVPSTYQILLRKSRFRGMTFPELRWFQQAGGKLPNPCIRELLEAFPTVRFYLMYGQTEATARLSYLPPERLADKFGSIGRGLPSTKLEVLKPDGTAVVPASDGIGEIVATGENISPGYWNDPDETARYFNNGRLHTGDIARVDADGFIFIVERARDMIKCGGNRVSAKEVEDVIAELPEVVEVAAVGVPHELLGEAIKAFVVVAPSAQLIIEEVVQHCRQRLSDFKRPEEVVFLRSMPHNSSGKILKQQLAAMPSPQTCAPERTTQAASSQ